MNRIEPGREMPHILPFPQLDARQDLARAEAPAHKGGSTSDRPAAPIPLIKKLCDTLNAQRISYCQWKSNWKLDRWLSGEGDLDLLIDRSDAQRFVGLIQGLGFKQAEPPSDRMVPGILNFYGFDQEASKFVHLHVHYQLVIGHDLTKNFHLPIERLYLDSVTRTGVIPLPAAEFELIVFVLRMVLKHSTFESILKRRTSQRAVEQELQELRVKSDPDLVAAILPHVVPGVDPGFFNSCEQSLRSSSSLRSRTLVRRELQRRLHTFARRPLIKDAGLKVYRRLARTVTTSILHRPARKTFVNGGLLIAIVGGDGAGKTTALDALNKWLSKKFKTQTFHIGKPRRSPLTLTTIVGLRIRKALSKNGRHLNGAIEVGASPFPGYLQLMRWVLAGRDRCRLYTKARRFATNGGIALCDRYPLPQVRWMESANISRMVEEPRQNPLVRRLLKTEAAYYQKIMAPDLLIVLRLEPEIAVRRKTNESEHHVRSRSQEIWDIDWNGSNAYVINAAQPVEDVLKQLQSIIWAKL